MGRSVPFCSDGERPMVDQNRRIGMIINVIGGTMFVAIVVPAIFNVASYWIFDRSFGQITEFVLAASVWVSYVGMGELYKSGDHISVDLLQKSLPDGANRILRLIIDVVTLTVSLIITYFAVILTVRSTNKFTAILKIPYFFIDLAVVVGFASTAVYAVLSIVNYIRSILGSKSEN